jgi:hypothetical protein
LDLREDGKDEQQSPYVVEVFEKEIGWGGSGDVNIGREPLVQNAKDHKCLLFGFLVFVHA